MASQPASGAKVEGHAIVSREEWLRARTALLEKEKAFTRERDALARERRALPWVKVETPYAFDGADGRGTLAELFGKHSQLLVYHFMYAPDWEAGCKSCSFWADNFDRIAVHLAHRDAAFVAISRAPLATLEKFKRRMGWTFPWVSSAPSDFNFDFGVSFTPEALRDGTAVHNFARYAGGMTDLAGASAFYKDASGAVFHTYSTYARGLDLLNGAYNWLDLAPKGRDEDGLEFTMSWVRHRDAYED